LFLNFEINCAARTSLDPLGTPMYDPSETSGASRNRETWLRVIEDSRFGSGLPASDLLP
jgi:hypothetical protein